MTEMQTTATQTMGLREARQRAGIGLERCARFAGITVKDVIRYERGRTTPGIKNAAKIAHVLGVRVDRIEEFIPAVREVEAAGFVLAETLADAEMNGNGHKSGTEK
jgi:transcriptional regulator with XRE-family HTH domain